MTLDDIETSIFQGNKGMIKALDLVNEYNKKTPVVGVDILLVMAREKQSLISPAFSNQLVVTSKYKNYIKNVMPDEGVAIINCRDTVLGIIYNAEQDMNRRILSAKESQTKRNRMFEKSEVLKFMKNNFANMVTLLELYNLFINIKKTINRDYNGTS
jgi:hypothetical protein